MLQSFLLSGLVGFVATVFFIEILMPVALHIGLVDHPGGRKHHPHPTPVIGGIAIFAAFALAALTLDMPLSSFRALFAGAIILVFVGVLDDLKDTPANMRLFSQIAAGAIMTLWGGVVLADLGNLDLRGGVLELGLVAVPFTLFAATGVINSVNMVDGLDGLAASLTLVTAGALLLLAWTGGAWDHLALLVVLVSTLLAFLRYNLRLRRPALVFMGDAGSMFLGFILAWLLIYFSQGPERLMSPTTALWLFALPLLDTLCVILWRIKQQRSPLSPDRAHCHHLLLDAGLSRRNTLAVMVAFAVGAASIGLLGEWLGTSDPYMLVGFLILFGFYVWAMRRLQLRGSRPESAPLCLQPQEEARR